MVCNVTVNGTLIPQDPEDKDMCVLFLKYGRCRFKQKCKKSHWVPPLPEEPFPVDIKPPLPNNELSDNEIDKTSKQTFPVILSSETLPKTSFDQSHLGQDIALNSIGNITGPTDVRILSSVSQKEKNRKKTRVILRRFTDVFQDEETSTRCSGIEKMFDEANVYCDKLLQKVMPVNSPQNKAEKRHLKLIRRLHWNYTQKLQERLNQFPPSYHLKFDRSKINFTRLRPYIYVLVHECMCPNGVTKPVKPSSLDYLIADTLIVYLKMKYITAQEAETKLHQWGARAVRARQCIDHLWHIMAISSKMPQGCVSTIVDTENEVLKKSRATLDYAYACYQALKQTTLRITTTNNAYFPRKVCSTIKQGLETKRLKALQKKKGGMSELPQTNYDKTDNHKITIGLKKTNVLLDKIIQRKRKRSKQFKNVSLHDKKKIKDRCLHLLTTLN